MRCDLRTVKHTLQNVYPCCRSVRSAQIDTWLIRTVTVRVYWTTLWNDAYFSSLTHLPFSLSYWVGKQQHELGLSLHRHLVLEIPTNPDRVTDKKKQVTFWGKYPLYLLLFTDYRELNSHLKYKIWTLIFNQELFWSQGYHTVHIKRTSIKRTPL